MSYSGAQVYLPRGPTAAAIARWLAERLPDAEVERSSSRIVLRLLGAELALAIDRAPHVRVEAQELAERAPAGAARLLRRATRRIEILPRDPRADVDDLYDALLLVFETLRGMPEVVGFDPFDGAFYCADALATGAEPMIVYRVADLPEGLALDLPADAGPRGCLFWIHPPGGAACEALMAALPEPELDHVDEGLALATLVMRLGGRGGRLAAIVPPRLTDGEPTWGLGFHTGPADVTEQFLRAAGHDLRPASQILDGLAIVEVRAADDSPCSQLVERTVCDGRLRLGVLRTAGRGLFTVEGPAQRWALLDRERREMIERELPPAGVVTDIKLRPVAPRRAARTRDALERLCREHDLAAPEPEIGATVLRLLPHAVLTAGSWDGPAADIKALARRKLGGEWLAVIAGAWVERMFHDGPVAANHIDLFTAIDGWLEQAIGREALREATVRALERIDHRPPARART
ncbi:hypothetical protein [Nannocystis bainbridge]|uniref:Uncharacterized protein n=1 Tax=Nannocystis bainbridge TaxID=2995303 RepID=A0ABT5DQ99_9BACT|nr:hypothetical protein [Nannocystis bainbridge]MDC0715778.1 hypothetical protein [Nannocystis bainbridge]